MYHGVILTRSRASFSYYGFLDYWGALMHDYNAVVKKNPKQLTAMIQKGVPSALRGLIWQLLAKSKDLSLEATYAELLKGTSTHEKQITRDLSRTFPNHEYFQAEGLGQESLFNVVKAYSLYDPEVGYCQGLSFVVGPLLLNVSHFLLFFLSNVDAFFFFRQC